MSFLSSNWMIALAILGLVLVVLFLIGRKSVHHEITIKASPELVWAVLTDTKAYTEWNPVMIPLEGELREGAKVKYEFRQDENNISQIPSTVRKMIPNQLLNQGGGMPGILSFDHQYILKPEGDLTRVTIHEEYRGIGVNFWNPAPVEKAYGRLNQALKNRVESLTP